MPFRPRRGLLRTLQSHPPRRSCRASRALAACVLAALGGCGDDSSPVDPGPLPTEPVQVEPAAGASLDTDRPIFTVQNANGFDSGEADYTFWVTVASSQREVASLTVPAGRGATSVQFPGPLLRGATLEWMATAVNTGGGQTATGRRTFRLPPVECGVTSDPYARTVVDFFVPAVCLANNIYNDPEEALGPPDGDGQGPDMYTGFVSLGNAGWVTVDMEGCTRDEPGDDVRVFQVVSGEPVTLLASSSPDGPWVVVEYRKPCGNRVPGMRPLNRQCTFDLAEAGIEETRYYRVQDGELFPCPGGTVTEGADIDAVEILSPSP